MSPGKILEKKVQFGALLDVFLLILNSLEISTMLPWSFKAKKVR